MLTYFPADLDTREAVLVDPHGPDLPLLPALLAARKWRLCWVWRAHLRACPLQPRPVDSEALWDSVTLCFFILPDETLLFAGLTRGEFLARMAALPEKK